MVFHCRWLMPWWKRNARTSTYHNNSALRDVRFILNYLGWATFRLGSKINSLLVSENAFRRSIHAFISKRERCCLQVLRIAYPPRITATLFISLIATAIVAMWVAHLNACRTGLDNMFRSKSPKEPQQDNHHPVLASHNYRHSLFPVIPPSVFICFKIRIAQPIMKTANFPSWPEDVRPSIYLCWKPCTLKQKTRSFVGRKNLSIPWKFYVRLLPSHWSIIFPITVRFLSLLFFYLFLSLSPGPI